MREAWLPRPRAARPSGVVQRQCACGAKAPADAPCEACAEQKFRGQPKLALGSSQDPLEHEADRVAEQVLATPGGGGVNAAPSKIQRFTSQVSDGAEQAPPSVERALAASGRPLDAATQDDMERRFGHDFSGVRVHQGGTAEQAAADVGARAYTVGSDIVFGAGQFAPQTSSGARLLAHELTHVVQQSGAGAALVRRDTFTGGPGATATDQDRPLNTYAGPMLPTNHPGGTVVPNTASQLQNCAGDSTSINRWVNWPHLGLEIPNLNLPANWAAANSFVPSGCTRVNCGGVSVQSTRCRAGELDSIVYLYRWPVIAQLRDGTRLAGTQSDFHMMGRIVADLPKGWHSKMDARERVVDIREPIQSLHDAYPHTALPDRTISQLCFCCDRGSIGVQ